MLVSVICYCSLIFVDISVDDTALTVQDDNISNSTVNSGLSMYSSCVFHSAIYCKGSYHL